MRSIFKRGRIAGLVAVASVTALTFAPTPVGAHISCPPGVTDPTYCINLPPIAVTGFAGSIGQNSGTLNGTVGGYGDATNYMFQYGTTTSYGLATAVQTLPTGSATSDVAVAVTGLAPGTLYHFRIVAQNADGTTAGDDSTFTTAPTPAPPPIIKVVAKHHVKHHKKFKVRVFLQGQAQVTIELINGLGVIVRKFDMGVRGPGTVKKRIRAPRRIGKYKLAVFATYQSGPYSTATQELTKKIKVF